MLNSFDSHLNPLSFFTSGLHISLNYEGLAKEKESGNYDSFHFRNYEFTNLCQLSNVCNANLKLKLNTTVRTTLIESIDFI